jgi:hypothetical protein
MDDDQPTVPSLSPEPAAGAPKSRSRSQAKRVAVQQGKPLPTTFGPPEPAQAPQVQPPVEPRAYARWRLAKDFDFYRGASMSTWSAGEVLSEQHYDIEALRRQGAELERLP